jgi:single-strand DNA-binding protein
MANETQITILGNLVADPEVRFIPSGAAVANFTVASTPRTFDRNSNEFKDGETLFMRCSVWRDQAENVGESLTKGMAVIVQGNLKQRSYEKDGEKRTVVELDVTEVGPSLRNASAKVTKGGAKGGQQAPQQSGGFAQQAPQGGQFGAQQAQWPQQGGQPQWGQQQTAPAPF